jgi:hypothetical protein
VWTGLLAGAAVLLVALTLVSRALDAQGRPVMLEGQVPPVAGWVDRAELGEVVSALTAPGWRHGGVDHWIGRGRRIRQDSAGGTGVPGAGSEATVLWTSPSTCCGAGAAPRSPDRDRWVLRGTRSGPSRRELRSTARWGWASSPRSPGGATPEVDAQQAARAGLGARRNVHRSLPAGPLSRTTGMT